MAAPWRSGRIFLAGEMTGRCGSGQASTGSPAPCWRLGLKQVRPTVTAKCPRSVQRDALPGGSAERVCGVAGWSLAAQGPARPLAAALTLPSRSASAKACWACARSARKRLGCQPRGRRPEDRLVQGQHVAWLVDWLISADRLSYLICTKF